MYNKKDCNKLYQEYRGANNKLSALINGPENRGSYKNKIINQKDAMKPRELAKEPVQHYELFLKEIPGAFLSVRIDADK